MRCNCWPSLTTSAAVTAPIWIVRPELSEFSLRLGRSKASATVTRRPCPYCGPRERPRARLLVDCANSASAHPKQNDCEMQRSGSLHVIACVLAVPHINPSSNKSFLPLLESCCSCTVDNSIGTRWLRRCAVEYAAAADASSSSVHCTHTLYNPMHNYRSAYSCSRCLEHAVEANSVHPTIWTNALGSTKQRAIMKEVERRIPPKVDTIQKRSHSAYNIWFSLLPRSPSSSVLSEVVLTRREPSVDCPGRSCGHNGIAN